MSYGVASRDRRAAAGLCPYCGQPPAHGRKACAACLERNRERNKRYYERIRTGERYRGRTIAFALCERCDGRASIRRNDDTHEATCGCGWTRVEIQTGDI
jgi:hypothetical protein